MPRITLDRANEILKKLEHAHNPDQKKKEVSQAAQKDDNLQLSFIQLDDPLVEQIKEDILNTDINTLTPVEALMKLNEIKKLLSKKKT